MDFERMMDVLWKLKELGYFETVRGFIFGRPLFYKPAFIPERDEAGEKVYYPDYSEALLERLSEYSVPIIMDADIGHKGPQMVMLNGMKARIESKDGKGRLIYKSN